MRPKMAATGGGDAAQRVLVPVLRVEGTCVSVGEAPPPGHLAQAAPSLACPSLDGARIFRPASAGASKTPSGRALAAWSLSLIEAAFPGNSSPRLLRRARARPKQTFTVSHHREADFTEGLRTYAKYRDLGIAPATGGMVQAHVIRFIPPFRPEEASTPHYHDVDFQMIYVLKEFEGEGMHTFEAGSCWIQPPRIKHAVRVFRRL